MTIIQFYSIQNKALTYLAQYVSEQFLLERKPRSLNYVNTLAESQSTFPKKTQQLPNA